MKKFLLSALTGLFLHTFAIAQEYPLQITGEGHLVVEVILNGSVKSNFILDTGAGANIVSSKTLEKLGDNAAKSGFFTGFRHDGDRVSGEVYQIGSLAIGERVQKQALIGLYPPLDQYGVDGLVSLKFFEDKPFTIDYKNQKIRFLETRDVDRLAASHPVMPITLHQYGDVSLDLFIPLRLNQETPVKAQFDTGSGYGVLLVHPYFLNALGLDKANAKTGSHVTPVSGTELRDYQLSLDTVTAGGDRPATLGSGVLTIFRENMIHEALVGSDFFRDRAVTIDIPGKRFIVHD